MTPIIIDITDRSNELGFSREDSEYFMEQLIGKIANSFYGFWRKDVMNSDLRSTKSMYLKSMYIDQVDNKTWQVGLNPSFLVNAVELGAAPWDIKEGFWKSPHKKMSKEGKMYFHVPFKVATPEALATSEVFSGSMPEEIHAAVKSKNKAGDSTPLRLNEIPEQFRAPKTRERIELYNGKIAEAYTHKSSIYEGIQKSNLPGHSGYVSFRTASETSPNAFIHTGIQARNFMNGALDSFTSGTLADIQNQALQEFLGD